MSNQKYDENAIRQLDPLESIRRSPGRFLGDCKTPWKAVEEVLDNCLDEYVAGHCTRIHIRVTPKQNRILLCDDGRGIPIGMHPKLKIPTIIAIFTQKDTGGKFDREKGGYGGKMVIGTHGVGTKATNALSKTFRVWTYRDKSWWYQGFKKGGKPESAEPGKVPAPPFLHKSFRKGTQIEFVPNPKYFESSEFDVAMLRQRSKDLAVLCPGLRVTFQVDDEEPESFEEGGHLLSLVEHDTDKLLGPALVCDVDHIPGSQKDQTMRVQLGFVWEGGATNMALRSFVNTKETIEHGLHKTGVLEAIAQGICAQAKKEEKFEHQDLWVGMRGVIHLQHLDPKFSSQTKERLIAPRGVSDSLTGALSLLTSSFFAKHAELSRHIIERATRIYAARQKHQAETKAEEDIIGRGLGSLPAKLVKVIGGQRGLVELYFVEGESASGTAKQARDRSKHEILVLTGKPPNAARRDLGQLQKNPVTKDIIASVGCGIGSKCDPRKARVGKVFICADADPDGNHIAALLITLFAVCMRPMLEEGRVAVINPPLFKAVVGDLQVFGSTQEELREKLGVKYEKADVSYLKGHGEVGWKLFQRYAFNPLERKITEFNLNGDESFAEVLELMGQSTHLRKKILGLGR